MAGLNIRRKETLHQFVSDAFAHETAGTRPPSRRTLALLMENIDLLNDQTLTRALPFILHRLIDCKRRPKSVGFTVLEWWMVDHVADHGPMEYCRTLSRKQRLAIAKVLRAQSRTFEMGSELGYRLAADRWAGIE